MNNETFILAVLVKKNIITKDEAKRLQKSLRESITNADLTQMLDKVSKALENSNSSDIEKIDAKDFIK